jgi:hypothetical protein
MQSPLRYPVATRTDEASGVSRGGEEGRSRVDAEGGETMFDMHGGCTGGVRPVHGGHPPFFEG